MHPLNHSANILDALTKTELGDRILGLDSQEKVHLIDPSQAKEYDTSTKAYEVFKKTLPLKLQKMINNNPSYSLARTEGNLLHRNLILLERKATLPNSIQLPPEYVLCALELVAVTGKDEELMSVSKDFRQLAETVIWKTRYQNLIAGLGEKRYEELLRRSGINPAARMLEIALRKQLRLPCFKVHVKAVFKQLWKEARSVNEGTLPDSGPEPLSVSAIRNLDQLIKHQKDQDFLTFVKVLPGGTNFLDSEDIEELDLEEKAQAARGWFESNLQTLNQITRLNLAGQKLKTLPPEIGKLVNLSELNLWANKLATLPKEIGMLRNLVLLHLGDNELAALPPEIGNLVNLQGLDLSSNPLVTLPPEIGNLRNLLRLSLERNELETFPQEIRELTSLIWLSLGKNKLKTISPQIGNLVNLQFLYLTDNELEAIPPEIGNLRNLRNLNLQNNKLEALPPEIGNLRNLRYLGLSNDHKIRFLPLEVRDLLRSILLNTTS